MGLFWHRAASQRHIASRLQMETPLWGERRPTLSHGVAGPASLTLESTPKGPAESGRLMTGNVPLGSLRLLRVELLPFFAFLQHKCFGIFERLEDAFPLDDIARLAAGDKVFHFPRSAVSVRMDMVNSEDQPVCELMQAIQSAILAFKLVTSEYLHGILPRQAWCGPSEEFLELTQCHGSSSQTEFERRRKFKFRAPFGIEMVFFPACLQLLCPYSTP